MRTSVIVSEPSGSLTAIVIESGMSVSSEPLALPEPVGASATASTITACVPVRVAVTPPVSVVVTARSA